MAVGSVMVLLLNSIEWGIIVVLILIETVALIPFQVFMMLLKLFWKPSV